MIDLNELRAKVNAQNLTEVAKATNLPYFRVLRFVRNVTDKPSYELVVTLANHVDQQAKK